jgi:hypothetical protein
MVGNYEAFAPGTARVAKPTQEGAEHEVTREQIEGMAARLAAKLEREPDNAEGWAMLAWTYYSLQRYNDAVPAFERATTLIPNDARLLADYADAVGGVEGGLNGKAQALIARALAADPTHWKALALAGTVAFERKDYKQAALYWEKTKATVPAGSPLASSIDASIAEARQLGGLAAGTAAPTSATTGALAAPSAATNATLAGTVSLAPALAAKAAPTDTVFIFARAAEGPKMPLAILRKQVKDLPVAFTLDDSMAMTPNSRCEISVGRGRCARVEIRKRRAAGRRSGRLLAGRQDRRDGPHCGHRSRVALKPGATRYFPKRFRREHRISDDNRCRCARSRRRIVRARRRAGRKAARCIGRSAGSGAAARRHHRYDPSRRRTL